GAPSAVGPLVYTFLGLIEAVRYVGTVIDPVRNCLRGNDPGIRGEEIEAGAAVPGLHARTEGPAFPQVDGALGGMPVVRCCVPLSDVGGIVVCIPDLLQWRVHDGLDGDLHLSLPRNPLVFPCDERATAGSTWPQRSQPRLGASATIAVVQVRSDEPSARRI